MKTANVFLFSMLISSGLMAQIFQTAQLSAVIKKCYADSVQKTERLAALKFHSMINQYRKENKIDSLAWDDTLWLASRNHNIWMGENAKLSHTQIEKTKFFTGKDPGDRYNYATVNKGGSSWSGENALYNYNDNGSSVEEISGTMANTAFNQWKNSPGHDENMRAPHSHSHGTAFYLEPDGPVWATDLFSFQKVNKSTVADIDQLAEKGKNNETESINIKTTGVKKIRTKDARIFTEKFAINLANTSSAKKSKSAHKAAQRHADYLVHTKTLTHEQKKDHQFFYGRTEKQRMLKATFGLYFFTQRKYPVSESLALIHLTELPENLPAFANEVLAALDAEKKLKGNPVSSGFGVAFKQTKKSLDLYVVRVEKIKEEPSHPFDLSSK